MDETDGARDGESAAQVSETSPAPPARPYAAASDDQPWATAASGYPADAQQPAYGHAAYGHPAYGQPPYGQPPYGQPPYGQPPYGQPPYGSPASGLRTGIVVPPSEAGFTARERPGLGLALVVASGIVATASIFQPWYRTVPGIGATVSSVQLTPFDLPERITELGGEQLPGPLVPILLLVVTVLSAVLGVVATIGLRSPARTLAARIAAWAVVQAGSAAYLAILLAAVNTATEPFMGDAGMESEYVGLALEPAGTVWVVALGALAWSALIGPSVVWQAGPSVPQGAAVRTRLHPVSMVFGWLAAALMALSVLALPWFSAGGESTTFLDVADSLDGSARGLDVAEAYFGGAGFGAIVAVLAAAGLITVATTGALPVMVARVVGFLVGGASLAIHLSAIDQIDADPEVWSAGPYLVPAALALLLIAAFLPAKSTVRLPV